MSVTERHAAVLSVLPGMPAGGPPGASTGGSSGGSPRSGATGPATAAAPPGVDPERFRLALLEDSYEVAADMGQVTAALALHPPDQPEAEELTWPGTPVLRLGERPHAAGDEPRLVAAVLAELAGLGADEGAVLAGDAPDLPVMLLGKLFQGLEHAAVAACPAERGGLVALAARLPATEWLATADVGLDTADALSRLRAAAPAKRALSVSPGWRRIRRVEDVARLDPGLEGWESTRALLSGRRRT